MLHDCGESPDYYAAWERALRRARTLDSRRSKLAAFDSEMAARPPFRDVGVNVFDAGLLTALLQKNPSR
jgi:hypothetical protein